MRCARLTRVLLLLLMAGCRGTAATERDAAVDVAKAETGAADDGLPDTAALCPAAGVAVCATGPRGAVTTSAGPGDCFATPATGFVWQIPETPGQAASAVFCGDIASVLESGGPLDYPACQAETAITTPTCRQTGGGTGTAPAKYEWYFQCAGGCTTTISFLEHGIAD